ncbi:MAG: hypothetical protein WKG32_10255 [Gemmatimonadaceae bacterium]
MADESGQPGARAGDPGDAGAHAAHPEAATPAPSAELDGVARRVLDQYAVPLARAGLRAEYRGLSVHEAFAGVRESALDVWIYRDAELVDSVEVPIERPGLSPLGPAEAELRLKAELFEVTQLHAPRARWGWGPRRSPAPVPVEPAELTVPANQVGRSSPSPEPATPRGSIYARRLRLLVGRVLPVASATAAAAALANGLIAGHLGAAEVAGSSFLAFVTCYLAGLPTAGLASLVHTKVARTLGRETTSSSALLGVGIGVVAGLATPWFIPVFGDTAIPLVAGMVGAGGTVGGVYGWLVARRAPISAVRAAGMLRGSEPTVELAAEPESALPVSPTPDHAASEEPPLRTP